MEEEEVEEVEEEVKPKKQKKLNEQLPTKKVHQAGRKEETHWISSQFAPPKRLEDIEETNKGKVNGHQRKDSDDSEPESGE